MRKPAVWSIAVLVCIVLLVFLSSVSLIVTSPSLTPNGEDLIDFGDLCVDLDESNDFLCNVGEDEEGPIPFVLDEAEEPELSAAVVLERGISYKGVALSGAELRDDSGALVPDDNDAHLFIYKGMNTFRVPFLWQNFAERDGTIKSASPYVRQLDFLINNLTLRNASVILVLYNNMSYDNNGIIGDCPPPPPCPTTIIDADGIIRNCTLPGLCPDPNTLFLCQCVIPPCSVPSFGDVTALWSNVVRRYYSRKLGYGIMNEAGDAPAHIRLGYIEAALLGIRRTETCLGLSDHLVLVAGTDSNRLLTWFRRGNTNSIDLANIVDPTQSTAIVVHMYFDDEMRGQYINNQCMPPQLFQQLFDTFFREFASWMINKTIKVFVGEIGAPDTAPCRENLQYFLDRVSLFGYGTIVRAGFIGWTLWPAGKRWSGFDPLSLSPGGNANRLLWQEPQLYQKYLVPTADRRVLELNPLRRAIRITNNSPQRLIYLDGYVPYQFIGTANIEPGGVGYLYSNAVRFSVPTANLRLRYTTASNNTVFAIGLFEIPPDLGIWQVRSDIMNRDGTPVPLRLVTVDNCPILALTPGSISGESRCYSVRPV